MAQTIKLKRSATQNAVPSTSSLALGEIAINTYDGKLFIKKDVSGTESIVTIGEVGANSIGPTELASTAVTAGSYGSTSAIPVITIDADGRITSASTATISGLSANSVTSIEIAQNSILTKHIDDNQIGIDQLNVTDGTSGQALTTDGAGTLSFSTVASSLSGAPDTDITTPSSGQILVHDGTDSFDNVSISGDATLSSAGVLTIATNAIESTMIAQNSILTKHIDDNQIGIDQLNVTDGTSGQVLTTDGAGSLSFSSKVSTAQSFYLNSATGDGSTTDFSLSTTPAAESNIIAFIDGVFQTQDSYTFSGTTLSFSAAPPNGTKVVVYVVGAIFNGNSVVLDTFSGDGSTTAFTLSENPENENNTQIYIDGVYQQKSEYSISSQTLTFSSAPPTGTNNIEVVSFAVTNLTVLNANSVESASIATGAVGTTELADDAVTIGKIADAALVIESEGISSNDNDTTLPTSAAVKDYVDSQVAGKDALSELSGDTDDVTEGSTNLYYTDARADARISNAILDSDTFTGALATNVPSAESTKAYVDAQTTDETAEGSTNLYYTDARADARIAAADTDDLSEGSTNLYYTDARVGTYISGNRTYGNITTTGYLAGPSTFTIDPAAVGDNTGTLVIAGNLQVDGTTTTINSTTMTVDDLNITLASGAVNAAAANGAGITVDGASATITYDGTNDAWSFNKDVGIGTTNPSRKLEVNSTQQIAAVISNNSSTNVRLAFKDANSSGDNFVAAGAVGDNFVIFAGGGTEKLRVDTSGNVGIGTTSPSEQLHISNANDAIMLIESTGTDATDDANVQLKTTNGTFTIQNDRSLGTSGALTFAGNTSDNLVIDHSSGNVGIGTSSPLAPLSVVYSNNTANPQLDVDVGLTVQNTGTSSIASLKLSDTNGSLIWGDGSAATGYLTFRDRNASAERMRIDSSGNVGIGTSSPRNDAGFKTLQIGDSSTGSSQLVLDDNDSNGPWRIISNQSLIINDDTAERMRIDSSGNVIVNNGGTGNGIVKINGATGSTEAVIFQRGGTEASRIGHANSADLTFSTGSSVSERMRIDSSGNVLIKTSSHTPTDTELLISSEYTASGTTEAGITLSARQDGNWRNSGIFANGTVLTFTTGDLGLNGAQSSSERMRIDSSGNVSIGTTGTNRKLTVTGSSTTQGTIYAYTNEIHTGTDTAAHVSIRSDNASASGDVLHVRGDGSGNLLTIDKSGTEKLVVDSSGNVLVGTTSKFNAYATRFITQSIATPATAVGGEACPILELVGNRNANPGNQNAMIQFWNKTSTATEVGRISSIQGTAVNSGALTFATYAAGTYDEALRIDQNGNVGIGTTSPSVELHVYSEDQNALKIQTNTAINQIDLSNSTNSPTYITANSYALELKADDNGWGGTASAIKFNIKATERMKIAHDGETTITGTKMNVVSSSEAVMGAQSTGYSYWRVVADNSPNTYFQAGTGQSSSQVKMYFTGMFGSNNTMTVDTPNQRVGIATTSPGSTLTVNGSLSKSSGSFRIDHPLESKTNTHDLVHSFVEAPQADNIYRGKVDLVDGSAAVNIDTVAGMTEGTFAALNREVQCFTTNESNWDAVKGSVSGNILTIESQNSESTATISWLVIGERQDEHMYDTEWTDDSGKVIVEPLK
jgi:hypothetical protein